MFGWEREKYGSSMGAMGAERATMSPPRARMFLFMNLVPHLASILGGLLGEACECYLLGPVGVLASSDNQDVDWFSDLLGLTQQVELRSTEALRFGFLISGGGEDDGVESEFG